MGRAEGDSARRGRFHRRSARAGGRRLERRILGFKLAAGSERRLDKDGYAVAGRVAQGRGSASSERGESAFPFPNSFRRRESERQQYSTLHAIVPQDAQDQAALQRREDRLFGSRRLRQLAVEHPRDQCSIGLRREIYGSTLDHGLQRRHSQYSADGDEPGWSAAKGTL